MRKFAALAILGTLLWGAMAPAQAGIPQLMWEDPAGDTALEPQPGAIVPLAPAAAQGLDLVSSTIARVKKDLVFAVMMAEMPADGAFPEAARMLYHFTVNGVEWRWTVKSFDIGKPDVVAQTGTDRIGKTYDGLFRLEQCVDDTTLPITLVNCNPVDYFVGAFDPATKTVTWSVPLATVAAKTGSIVGPTGAATTNPPCQICWVAHYAERSLIPTTMIDYAVMSASYTIPKK